MRRAVVLALAAGLLAAGPARAQQVVFTGDTGLLTYVIPAAQAPAFAAVMARLLDALAAGGDADQPQPALTLRLLEGRAENGFAVFVLVADPVVAGADYAPEQLIRDRVAPDVADDLLRAFKTAVAEGTRSVMDLRQRGAVTRDDALKARIEQQLGPLSSVAGAPADATRSEALERLRGVLWAVDGLRFDVINRGATRWRLRWTGDLRNISPLQPLNARVSVVFRDRDGRQLATAPTSSLSVGVLDHEPLSGVIDLDAAVAQRVTAVAALVETP